LNALEARLTVTNQTPKAVSAQFLQAQRNAPGVLRRQMAASVLLVKALGGGWGRSSLPAF
jgi:outer membrane protein TolC